MQLPAEWTQSQIEDVVHENLYTIQLNAAPRMAVRRSLQTAIPVTKQERKLLVSLRCLENNSTVLHVPTFLNFMQRNLTDPQQHTLFSLRQH